jgi:hypothetical protein
MAFVKNPLLRFERLEDVDAERDADSWILLRLLVREVDRC